MCWVGYAFRFGAFLLLTLFLFVVVVGTGCDPILACPCASTIAERERQKSMCALRPWLSVAETLIKVLLHTGHCARSSAAWEWGLEAELGGREDVDVDVGGRDEVEV